MMDFNSLSKVKNILEDFGQLSGLECNVEKTVLLQIGSVAPITADILSLGFLISNEITVLGLKLKNEHDNFQDSWGSIENKVQMQINHWKRFNLSLPGRINIAKCMMYSQLNYLGCFLPHNEEYANRIGEKIENFVTGNIQIAKKRLFLTPQAGGLGLFNVKDFLDSQKVSWIVRARKLDEIWKIRIFIAGHGNVYNVRSSFINQHRFPVLHSITNAYERFLAGFTKHKENFWESPVFENQALFLQLRQKTLLTKEFFGDVFFFANEKKIRTLKVFDFFETKNTYRSWENFVERSNLNLSRDTFNELKKIASNAKLKHSKTEVSEIKTTELSTFLNFQTKGCKRYRKKIVGNEDIYIPHNMVKFASNTETIIGFENSKKLNGIWNLPIFSNSTRTFLFKLHNNTAGYNNAVAHFIPGHSPNCTFCDVIRNPEVEDETPLHLFFTCSISERFVEDVFSWILGAPANVTRQEFFVCFNRPNHRQNDALFLFSALIKKFMWDCKQRFALPCFQNIKIYLREEVKIISFCSIKANVIFQNSGIVLPLG